MSSAARSSPRITARITSLDVLDVRFPTSEHLDGSDAMNPEPDYSAAYVVLRTDAGDGLEGHALAFTTGRGNDAQAAAIATLAPHVIGRPALMRELTRVGMRSRSLMEWVLRIMANLLRPEEIGPAEAAYKAAAALARFVPEPGAGA